MKIKLWAAVLMGFSLALVTDQMQAAAAAPSGQKGREYYEPRGEIVWEVPTSDKVVALTFDDGPDPVTTPAILKLLKQYDAKATFFVVGNRVDEYPDILFEEYKEGHEIGNHTYKHTYFNLTRNVPSMTEEISKTENSVLALTGQRTTLFRPPGGYYNSKLIDYTTSHGYLAVLWSWHQDTRDWAKPGVWKITDKVLKNLRSGDIILMHDHVENSVQTVEALKVILPEIKKRGYQCVTVSELLKHQRGAEPVKNNDSKKAGP
ncbi:polysaccharide deacetylase family protein [Paenibacillus physcomitrellae]|uniref:Polysaccharide deacetylase family sporulation protein PdaB n=1 Tax=Paenibacillus physcomitrellae TaxID=1619311 RepID=A0ABQ1FLI6_9BACL|nr:polysaccharide deacetylase family protein [Paenibacillus physcomitrellae]GGA21298.1 polysaccharide deacetylase family sporulation protein PdaB [Paenibacillus physcomitrellae]